MARRKRQRFRNRGARFRAEDGTRINKGDEFYPSDRDLAMYGWWLDLVDEPPPPPKKKKAAPKAVDEEGADGDPDD